MQQDERTKRNDIILEVIYKLSLSPQFSLYLISQYIRNLEEIYNNNHMDPKVIRTNDDLIKRVQYYPELNKMIPPPKCDFPPSFQDGAEFIQIPIISDGNCLFSCLAYLDIWNTRDHEFVRNVICDNLDAVINILRKSVITLDGGHSMFHTLLVMDYYNFIKEFENDPKNQIYIKKMRDPNTWGSVIEILTAIYITKQNINLYTIAEYSDGRRIGLLHEDFEHIKKKLIKDQQIKIDDRKIPLNLYFCKGNHYELLQPVNGPPLMVQGVLRSNEDRKKIFKTAEQILKHTYSKAIAQIREEEARAESEEASPTKQAASATPTKPIAPPVQLKPSSSTQHTVQPVKPTKDYICISDPEGEFSDSECREVSRKVSSLSTQIHHVLDGDEQIKYLVIDTIMSEIMRTPEYNMELYEFHLSQLNQLYSTYREEGFPVDIVNFRIIVQDSPDFKHLFPYMCSFTNEELKSKFTEIPTLNNGNCLFQSLQLGIEQWKTLKPLQVRNVICDSLFNVIVQIIVIIGNDIIYNEISKPLKLPDKSQPITNLIITRYVEYMRKEGSFGGLLEIITAIFLTQHDIVIYNMKGQVNPQYDSIKTKLTQGALLNIAPDKPKVYLYHCNRTGDIDTVEHYELLVEKPVSYKYKYMKYKMKYLTLKNNTHYNKYL